MHLALHLLLPRDWRAPATPFDEPSNSAPDDDHLAKNGDPQPPPRHWPSEIDYPSCTSSYFQS